MKVLIAGLGLIGGSFALALRDHGIAEEILGVEAPKNTPPRRCSWALRTGS